MDAIKKKMQAMKVEKDNAMDRADVCEQAAKDAKVWTNVETFFLNFLPRCDLVRLRRRWRSW